MKKFNIYANNSLYSTEYCEELIPDLNEDLKKEVENLAIGESYHYTNSDTHTQWEIERVL